MTFHQQGLATFLPQLNAGVSRTNVALQIFASDEYFRILVTATFNKFLHRAATAADLNVFVPALKAGMKQETFIGLVVASVEYYQAQAGSATTQDGRTPRGF